MWLLFSMRVAEGKSCLFGLLCLSFVNVYQFVCVFLSPLVLRVVCGLRLYKFLAIAFFFTLGHF